MLITVESAIEELADKFEGWISGVGTLEDFLRVFSEIPFIAIIALLIVGVALLIFGKKLFKIFYTFFWTVAGGYLGFLAGQTLEPLYTIELVIILGVLLPIVACKAREVFIFTMVLFGTGFFAVYVAGSLGTPENLSVLEPPFVLAGSVLGCLAVKYIDSLMIVSTSLLGALFITLSAGYYLGDLMDLIIMLLTFITLALFGVFFQIDIYLKSGKRRGKKKTKTKGERK